MHFGRRKGYSPLDDGPLDVKLIHGSTLFQVDRLP